MCSIRTVYQLSHVPSDGCTIWAVHILYHLSCAQFVPSELCTFCTIWAVHSLYYLSCTIFQLCTIQALHRLSSLPSTLLLQCHIWQPWSLQSICLNLLNCSLPQWSTHAPVSLQTTKLCLRLPFCRCVVYQTLQPYEFSLSCTSVFSWSCIPPSGCDWLTHGR